MENPVARRVEPIVFEEDGAKMIALNPNDGLTDRMIVVSAPAYYLITLMDGSRDIEGICGEFYSLFQRNVEKEEVENLVEQLDNALLLDNERYQKALKASDQEFAESKERPAAFAGKSYPADPEELSALLNRELGANPALSMGGPEALVAPHIDFRVGAGMMADAWREVPPGDDQVIVILGTGHYMEKDFFSCIDKPYSTPLGNMEVDSVFLTNLQENFGEDIYQNAICHKMEHSIEFPSLFLAHMAKSGKAPKAVPILLSFPENIWDLDDEKFNGVRLQRFLDALRKTASEYPKKIRYFASVDFAHIGQKFGDIEPLTEENLALAKKNDMEMLDALADGDKAKFLDIVKKINGRSRICGFPPLYALLELAQIGNQKLLGYKQNVEGDMENMVSFATIIIY